MQIKKSSYLKKSCSALLCLFLFSNVAYAGSKRVARFDPVALEVANLSDYELDAAREKNSEELRRLDINLDEVELSGKRMGLTESEISQAKLSMMDKQRELLRKSELLSARLMARDPIE